MKRRSRTWLSSAAPGLASLLLVAASLPAQEPAAHRLEFRILERSSPLEGVEASAEGEADAAPGAESREQRGHLVLGADTLLIQVGDAVQGLDFRDARSWVVDRAAGACLESSLFPQVAFQAFELRNREWISEAMEAAEVDAGELPTEAAWAEHDFSMALPDTQRDIQRTVTEGWARFALGEDELLAHTEELLPAGPELRRGFLRFLRHRDGAHPQILQALAELDGLPRVIRIQHYGFVKHRFEIELLALEELPVFPDPRGDLPRRRWAPSEFQEILAGVGEDPVAELDALAEGWTRSARAAFDEERHLEAFLLLMNASLSTGRPLPQMPDEQLERLQGDPRVGELFVALAPSNADEARAAIATLESLREHGGAAAHVLKVFEANTRRGFQENDAAKALMLEALAVNPHLCGLWKDLGDLYHGELEMAKAWFCWDFARELAPEHGLLQPLQELEASLREAHPDFF